MAENYSLGSRFGLNVFKQNTNSANAQQSEASLLKTVGDIVDSMTSYVAKHEDVFSGEVEKEIGMYSRQSMIVSMNMKAVDSNKHRFDMNI